MTSLCGSRSGPPILSSHPPLTNMTCTDWKHKMREAVTGLSEAGDESLLEQLLSLCGEQAASAEDIYSVVTPSEVRRIKEANPEMMSKLCFKLVERLGDAVDSSCRSTTEQQSVINIVRILARVIPFIFEDPDWENFFWSDPGPAPPLAHSLLLRLADLLFCPDFTVAGASRTRTRDEVGELVNIDSCEYIWERGVGCAQTMSQHSQHHHNRLELLRLVLVCLSEGIYRESDRSKEANRWVRVLASHENRHTLPLFTSLLNTVTGYQPASGLPYNHLLWTDSKEGLVEVALQVLIVTLETDSEGPVDSPPDNLFLNYLSRIHRDEDFQFILSGITRLLMNPLTQTYLPGSQKKVHFHQELLILFWKLCEHNRKFMYHVLKSSDVLEIVIPVLNYLNDARVDQSKAGLVHMGVFVLLLLSGERNFGVRLNKPYTAAVPMDISVFSGSHADLLIIVFHKIITTGHQRLQPLFECLLTILANISPYIKTLSMTAACKLLHLVEAFSTPWFLLANKTNHQLVFFLLEMLNNLVQYQFDGNSNLAYTMIRKRNVFHQLANLPTDGPSIQKTVSSKRSKRPLTRSNSALDDHSMEGSQPAAPAEPGTLRASLVSTPRISALTEGVSAHPTQRQLDRLTQVLQTNAAERGPMTEEVSQRRAKSEPEDECDGQWRPSSDWIREWKSRLPLQTIMRMLQVLVPQVEKMCIDKGLTDETEILRFLQNGTLVGLLPVPHPILIRRYQANRATELWFQTYMWGVVYLRSASPPLWAETSVKMFTVQRV